MKKPEKLHAEGDLIMKAVIICDDVSLVARSRTDPFRPDSLKLIVDESVGAKDFVKVAGRLSPEREWPLPVEKSHFENVVVYQAHRGYGINE